MAIVDKLKASNGIQVPEGKVLSSAKIICKKHGEITDKSFFLSYITNEDDKQIKHNHIYCTACICELLESLKKDGKMAEVGVIPVFTDKSEVEERNTEVTEKAE